MKINQRLRVNEHQRLAGALDSHASGGACTPRAYFPALTGGARHKHVSALNVAVVIRLRRV